MAGLVEKAGSGVGLGRWDRRTGSYRSSCLQQAGFLWGQRQGLGQVAGKVTRSWAAGEAVGVKLLGEKVKCSSWSGR